MSTPHRYSKLLHLRLEQSLVLTGCQLSLAFDKGLTVLSVARCKSSPEFFGSTGSNGLPTYFDEGVVVLLQI